MSSNSFGKSRKLVTLALGAAVMAMPALASAQDGGQHHGGWGGGGSGGTGSSGGGTPGGGWNGGQNHASGQANTTHNAASPATVPPAAAHPPATPPSPPAGQTGGRNWNPGNGGVSGRGQPSGGQVSGQTQNRGQGNYGWPTRANPTPSPAPGGTNGWSNGQSQNGNRGWSNGQSQNGNRGWSNGQSQNGNRGWSNGQNQGANGNAAGNWQNGRPGNGGQGWNNRDPRAEHGAYRQWDHDWRRDNRYDWRGWRDVHRDTYHLGRYYAPYRDWSYRRLTLGFILDPLFFADNYIIYDPWMYHLPAAEGPYRWVRYYDDALLVDTYTGEVVDVIYDFFW